MNERKRIPPIAKALLSILLIAGIALAGGNVWRRIEKKQQKPKVLAACAELAAGMTDEKYRLDELWKLLAGGKTEYSGSISFSSIEETLFPEEYRSVIPYLERSDIAFTLKKDDTVRKAAYLLEASLYFLTFTLDGYLDDTECILHLPDLHESYISFSPDNLRAQYEASFLYPIFGEGTMLPQGNLADGIFYNAGTFVSSKKEWMGVSREVYDEITVEKTEASPAVSGYEACDTYSVTIPTDVFRQFCGEGLRQNTGHAFEIKEDCLSFLVYLGRKNQISMLELAETELLADEKRLLCKLSLQPKGTENPWDKLQADAVVTLDGTDYGFTVMTSHEFTDTLRTVHIRASLTEPYVMKLLDIVMDYNEKTGETALDITSRISLLSFDGELCLKPLDTAIEKPEEDAVRIFELHFLEALRFANTIKGGFFKKME